MRTLIALVLTTLMVDLTEAQDATETLKPEQAPIIFQVLRGWRFDLGDHSVSLNRVAPPVLPSEAPPATKSAAVESAPAGKPLARTPQKKTELLFLSATVFEHSITEVRTFAGDRSCRFHININFNLLAGLGSFETADISYLLMLGVENRTRAEAEAFNKRAVMEGRKAVFKPIPPPETFSKTRSEYLIAKDEAAAQPPAETLAALDALLAFYDANRGRLAEDYVKREAARIAQEQWMKEHPPAQKGTVIHYWNNDTAPAPSESGEKR